jgi:hypothetical protein
MTSDAIIIGRKSPWSVLFGSALAIAIAIAFLAWSIDEGFNVSERPWAERRVWLWYITAYGGCPLLVIMACKHFASLAAHRFVALAVRGEILEVVSVTTKRMKLENLVALEISQSSLIFVGRNESRLEIGRLGFLGGWRPVVRRMRKISPGLELRRASRTKNHRIGW